MNKLSDWFTKVNNIYNLILKNNIGKYNGKCKVVMLDIDETILYQTTKEIPGAIDFVNKLNENFDIYFVTGRVDKGLRRQETLHDLRNFNYKELIMRPFGEHHSTFKLRIQKELNPVFSVGDQKTDYPDYLIQNPFYYINDEGEHINIK